MGALSPLYALVATCLGDFGNVIQLIGGIGRMLLHVFLIDVTVAVQGGLLLVLKRSRPLYICIFLEKLLDYF
jgi:hypothetical protein